MKAEIAHFGSLQGPKITPAERRRGTTVSNNGQGITVTAENYDPKVLSMRPDGWNDLRIKRVMLKEHIDRIAGMDESELMEMRADREIEVQLSVQ